MDLCVSLLDVTDRLNPQRKHAIHKFLLTLFYASDRSFIEQDSIRIVPRVGNRPALPTDRDASQPSLLRI